MHTVGARVERAEDAVAAAGAHVATRCGQRHDGARLDPSRPVGERRDAIAALVERALAVAAQRQVDDPAAAAMMAMMVKGPISKFIETLSENMSKL